MEKVQLLYVYVDNLFGFHQQEFNFSTKEKYHIINKDGNMHLYKSGSMRSLPEDFWGRNISEISLLIGDNGAGKTSLVRIICDWICKLSEGKYPKEKGVLLFEVGDERHYIGFEKEKSLAVTRHSCRPIRCDIRKIKMVTKSLKLVFFSNTLTELKLEHEYECMTDDSLTARLRKAEKDARKRLSDTVSSFNRNEFDRQISVALMDNEFPLKYINLELTKDPFENLINSVSEKNKSTMESVKELWYIRFEHLLPEKDNFKCILPFKIIQSFYAGIFFSLLKGINQASDSASELMHVIISTIYDDDCIDYECNNIKDCMKWMETFLESAVSDVRCQMREEWDIEEVFLINRIRQFCDYMARELVDESENIFHEWDVVKYSEEPSSFSCHFRIRLTHSNKSGFAEFWKVYKCIMPIMENVTISWEGSSGEKNWAGLYVVLREMVDMNRNVCFFLDEPDNTFHPEWKRLLIDKIVGVCNEQKNMCANIQIWITTHSPILLSDIPGVAVTYLKCDRNADKENIKRTVTGYTETFGQNIYLLFDDAFFLKDGVIGAFSSRIITDIVMQLHDLEEALLDGQSEMNYEPEQCLSRCEEYVSIVGEPLFRRQMEEYIYRCKRLLQLRNRQ